MKDYTDLTTRAQRMGKINYFKVLTQTVAFCARVLLIVATLYVLAMLNYVVQGVL